MWDLTAIRQKVRQVTGRYSSGEMSNSKLDEYINKFYLYTFPAEVKLNDKLVEYEYITIPNQQFYDAPSTFTNFLPLASINNKQINWYQDPDVFAVSNNESYSKVILGTGNGIILNFNTTIKVSFLPGSLIIGDNVESFYDTNTTYQTANINLTGTKSGTATINYSTGAISVTFNTAPITGQKVYLSYVSNIASEPHSVLYFNKQFKLSPVPDTAYKFRVKGYQKTTELTNSTDTPDDEQWGEIIAYGASKQIHSDNGEMNALAEIDQLYREQLALITRKTIQDLANVKATPSF